MFVQIFFFIHLFYNRPIHVAGCWRSVCLLRLTNTILILYMMGVKKIPQTAKSFSLGLDQEISMSTETD